MTTRLRVGLIADNYPDLGGSGGIGSYTRTVAGALAALGHDVEVFAFSSTPARVRRRIGAVWVSALPGWGRRREMPLGRAVQFSLNHRNEARRLNAFEVAVAVKTIARRDGRFDVIEAPDFGGLGSLLTGAVARRRAIRLHGAAALFPGTPSPWIGIADPERASVMNADSVSAPSEAVLPRYERAWGLSLGRARVIPNPVGWTPPPPTPKNATLDVLFVGRLEHLKGFDVFCEAVRHLPSDVRVGAAGLDARLPSGALGSETLRRATRGRGTYLGVLTHGELIDAVRGARIIAVPSRSETFGLVVVESMMWGTPVVAADIPCFRETTRNGVDAELFVTESPTSLADALSRLLADDAHLQAMSAHAYEAAQRFRSENVVHDLLDSWGA